MHKYSQKKGNTTAVTSRRASLPSGLPFGMPLSLEAISSYVKSSKLLIAIYYIIYACVKSQYARGAEHPSNSTFIEQQHLLHT